MAHQVSAAQRRLAPASTTEDTVAVAPRRADLALILRLGLFLVSGWLLSAVLLQGLFGQRLMQRQLRNLARNLAGSIRLSELAIERLPPQAVGQLSGLRIVSRRWPVVRGGEALREPARQLRLLLCPRLRHCPVVVPTQTPQAGIWIELESLTEPAWLFCQLSTNPWWPPDPALISLALISGSLLSGGSFLIFEVQRPLQRLSRRMARVGLQQDDPDPLPLEGAAEVKQLIQRFNGMVLRLRRAEQERATMLGGIAHDLQSPIARLRLRLEILPRQASALADLDALERITSQFLLFASGGRGEDRVPVPLDGFLAEVVAAYPSDQVQLRASDLHQTVAPIALGRALRNLIDNGLTYGATPIVVRCESSAEGVDLLVIDQGRGIPEDRRAAASLAFQRLDPARGGKGQCGLGLAIAQRVAELHGGSLVFRDLPREDPDGRFAVVIRLAGWPDNS
ncbi:MAG: HAMP domain-containing protein [Aphanocapsa feldmannii 277cV]|uniref:histidine kinase n=2 Tax=Aphanocapsa feldmannii TaxID=192050 RepID=A0A524RMI4_9CHRO|nr:MAG: HAMP domain-containing protein [Aphanocapsa feldmannii 277cV]TGH21115.1 MAG: HAMP domain-containing protein [Aphanocapsa feldmannii 277cI]